MAALLEWTTAALIVTGGVFLFVGSFGLAKLPDTMRRLHGPTKATTLGVGAMLVASMLYSISFRETSGMHELLITLFLFLTAPVTANMIAKAHIFRGKDTQDALPDASRDSGWATLREPPDKG